MLAAARAAAEAGASVIFVREDVATPPDGYARLAAPLWGSLKFFRAVGVLKVHGDGWAEVVAKRGPFLPCVTTALDVPHALAVAPGAAAPPTSAALITHTEDLAGHVPVRELQAASPASGHDRMTTGAAELARAIAARELSAQAAVQSHLDRIEEVNGALNAVTVTLADEALATAAAADAWLARGEPAPPLLGVPFTVKENIDVAGTVTTLGLRGGAAVERDAPHIAHLRGAGAIPIARTNLPDLALRWHTDNARHGATVNPFDASLSPGGSSGGDAVALASGMAAFAVGSDYGGSLRVPAALAGVYALRPTPGRLAQAFGVPPLMSRQLMASEGRSRGVPRISRRCWRRWRSPTRVTRGSPRPPSETASGPVALVLADDGDTSRRERADRGRVRGREGRGAAAGGGGAAVAGPRGLRGAARCAGAAARRRQ